MPPTRSPLELGIARARRDQLDARQAWARNPSAANYAAAETATERLDALLDQLREQLVSQS